MATSKDKAEQGGLDRRSFFRMSGAGAAVAATAVVGAAPATAAESQSEKTKARYKETEHVKNFYRVNRY